jgi:HTH-type transcriptional regulator/antitoxin MqsA
MTSKRACPACRGPVTKIRAPREIRIGRRSVIVEDEFQRCQRCGNEFYQPEQMRATQIRAAEQIRTRLGLISPHRIRVLRSKLQLTQRQLEQALGVGPKTVVRWERGTVFPSMTSNKLLCLLEECPQTLSLLRGLGGFAPQGVYFFGEAWTNAGQSCVAFKSSLPWSITFGKGPGTPTPAPQGYLTTVVPSEPLNVEPVSPLEDAA